MIQNIVYHGDGESITQIGSQAIVGTAAIFRKNSTQQGGLPNKRMSF